MASGADIYLGGAEPGLCGYLVVASAGRVMRTGTLSGLERHDAAQ
jgi:hypothetical protein